MEKRIRILDIDDEESFTFFVKHNLETITTHNFKIMTATSGSEGLSLSKPVSREELIRCIEITLNLH